MTAAGLETGQESLVVARPMRVAIGQALDVVELEVGDPWPPDCPARLDVFIRQGFVVRFESDGSPDKRSIPYVRRLGLKPPPTYPNRSWAQRAATLEQAMEVNGCWVRVIPGRPDGGDRRLLISSGRAYGICRGAPDSVAAREAVRRAGNGPSPRRRPRRRSRRSKGE